MEAHWFRWFWPLGGLLLPESGEINACPYVSRNWTSCRGYSLSFGNQQSLGPKINLECLIGAEYIPEKM